jgi:hypothetical protein
MALKGYLAGIFRSVTAEVDGEDLQQLLLNPGFEAGLDDWTDTGTVNELPFGRNGFGHYLELEAGADIEQTVELDTALASSQDIMVRVWAKAEEDCTLTLSFYEDDSGPSLLDSEDLTITDSPVYDVNGWGLWSMRVTAPEDTLWIEVKIQAGAAEDLLVDDCELAFMEQIAGATGELAGGITVETADITTFKSAQDDNGWRRHMPTVRSGEQINIRTFWSTDDTYIITETEPLFVQLYESTVTFGRWEFWAFASGLTGSFPLEGAREVNMTLTVQGEVGFTDTVAD